MEKAWKTWVNPHSDIGHSTFCWWGSALSDGRNVGWREAWGLVRLWGLTFIVDLTNEGDRLLGMPVGDDLAYDIKVGNLTLNLGCTISCAEILNCIDRQWAECGVVFSGCEEANCFKLHSVPTVVDWTLRMSAKINPSFVYFVLLSIFSEQWGM